MKKNFLHLVLIIILTIISGCSKGTDYTKGVDVEHFIYSQSSVGTTSHLIPENFLTMFEYGQNKYYRYTNETTFVPGGDMDKTLMYLVYSEDIYKESKDYILCEMNLDFSQFKSYNGYVFYFNEDFPHKTNFPFDYLMAGYNDTKNTLIFLGMSCERNKYPDLEYGETDFGKYLKIFFGEFYDFDA